MAALVLAWPGALAIGLSLGLLGSGGSILTVPVLVYLLGQNEKVAIASSLAIVGAIATVASLNYLRQGLIAWRCVWLFGLPGMAGTYLGAWSSAYVSGAAQLSVFAAVMVCAAYFMLKPTMHRPTAVQRKPAHTVIDGLLVGTVTGFVGVGGGFLIVPALVLLGGLPMHRAIATSLVIIALKSFTGFWKYLGVLAEQNLQVDMQVIVMISLIGMIGSLAGTHIGGHIDADKLKRGFAGFLVLMGIAIFSQSATQL